MSQGPVVFAGYARTPMGGFQGAFTREITPVTVPGRGGATVVETDEQPGKASPAKIPGLKPAFVADGTVTAANASSISDGAAALVLTHASVATRLALDGSRRLCIGQWLRNIEGQA